MSKPKIINNLPKFQERTKNSAGRGVAQALVLIASEAAPLTPIGATSNLINSQYVQVGAEGDRIVGKVGYTANYAAPVHDPKVKQRFRRAGARKEFLKLAAERAEPNIRAVITGAIKT